MLAGSHPIGVRKIRLKQVLTRAKSHVKNNPTMQLITGISTNTHSKSYILSFT